MPSPFPGMNPYLERRGVWHDFHESFFPYARAQLTPQLRPRYYTRIDENVFAHEIEADALQIVGRPDIGVFDQNDHADSGGTAVITEPETVGIAELEELSESYLRIVDRDNGELITVIELLSPANKEPGDNRRAYIAKRNALLTHGVNLVEIDLLRGGPRMPMIGLKPCDYCVFVSRPGTRPDAGLWRFALQDQLPRIHIPLRLGEPEATLDLKCVIDSVYDGAGYEDRVYQQSPEPPLTSEQAVWAAQFVPQNQAAR